MANKTEELVKQTDDTLAPRPDYIQKGDKRGLEGITKKDMLVPRLALAQNGNPQVTEGDPKFVPGMKVGELFNSITNVNYGREVIVQVVRKDALRAMQFKRQEDGGGVLDPDVPLNDERMKWGPNGEKPVATLFRDYLAVLIPSHELIALSFKSSGIATAKKLNGLIALRSAPIFAGLYKISTEQKLVPKPHRVYNVVNAGWASPEDFKLGESMWESLKDLDTAIDRETDDEDISFDPAEIEAGQ